MVLRAYTELTQITKSNRPILKSTILTSRTKSLLPWDGNTYISGTIVHAQK